MAISKILDFSAGSKFAIKLSQNIRYNRESQNCDWILFSVTPLLNLADSLGLTPIPCGLKGLMTSKCLN